jgi:lipoprotein-anchoring transpeptidase ErfK/SrfK
MFETAKYMSNRKIKKHHISITFAMAIFVFGILGVFFSVQAYPKVFSTNALLEKTLGVKEDESVVMNFSDPMIAGMVNNKVKIYPETSVSLSWNSSGRKLTITPQNTWLPSERYRISIQNGRNIMMVDGDFELYFETRGYPKLESFYPASGQKEVIVDIEDPILISFDQPLDDYQLKFEINPAEEISYEVDSSKKRVKVVFKNEYKKGEIYEINLYIKHKKEEAFSRRIYQTSFETLSPAPEKWSDDLSLRLTQAKKYAIAQIKEGKLIDINLKNQVMTIFENGIFVDAFLVSSGKKGMDTPEGSYQIRNKHPRPWSKTYGLYMPHWMAIVPSGKFGIHELPEWPGGYKEGANHLGIPVSHGCVRLGVGSAERVYNWAQVGTPVIVHK